MERIPVGAAVTVEEIYEGASYKLKDGESRIKRVEAVGAERIQNGTVLVDQYGALKTIIGDVVNAGTPQRVIPSISFTNTYNGLQRKGFGINNKFVYKDGEGWYWIQDDDGTKTGTLVAGGTTGTATPENPDENENGGGETDNGEGGDTQTPDGTDTETTPDTPDTPADEAN